jgi:hypothetical protein
MISQSAFEVTVQAVHNLSLRNKRHEVFSAVLQESITTFTDLKQTVLDDLAALGGTKGDIRMFIRIPQDLQKGFEQIRSLLGEVMGSTYGTREAVLVCSLLIAPRN